MEKLRFTQLFRESDKELSDDEKGDIIIMSFPKDEQDAIDAEYTEAKANHQLDSFFDKYKDILEASSGSDVEADNTETATDDEKSSETETATESEEASESVEGEDEDDANANTEEAENKDENDEGVTDKDFVNIIDNAMTVKLDDATEKDNEAFYRAMGVTTENKKHFEEYEEYFGFGLNGKPKESVRIMFETPFNWSYKIGDVVKKDDPLFKTVAYMNEFVLWRNAAEVFMNNETIRACDEPIFKAMENHIAGTELNKYIKQETDKLAKSPSKDELSVIGKSLAASKSGTTPILDKATGKKINQNNDIILFIYKKVYPSIIKMAKKGSIGKNPPANRRCVLGNNLAGTQLYKNLYLKAIGNVDLIEKPDDMLDEVIRDGYTTLLGGRAVVRATRDSISERPRYKAIFDTPQAGPVSIFDSNWIDNGEAKSMLVNYERAWDFVQDGKESFSVTTARKMTGKKGKTQGVGVPAKSYAMACQGLSDEVVKAKFDLGEISKIEYEGFQMAKKLVFGMLSDLEPFSVIASQVATDFGNYLQTLTRIGSHMLGVYNIYGEKYYSKEEIEKANPQDREKMLRINKEWEKATQNLKGEVSLDTKISGKDGEIGTIGDMIASKEPTLTSDDKLSLKGNVTSIKLRLTSLSNTILNAPVVGDAGRVAKIRAVFTLLCFTKYIYMALTHWEFNPFDTINSVIGKTKISSSGRPDSAGKIQHPIYWNQTEWVKDNYDENSDMNDAYAPYPIAGLADTKIGSALMELRSPMGLAYTAFTPEGIAQIDGDVKEFTQRIYSSCKSCLKQLGFDVDKIKTDDGLFTAKINGETRVCTPSFLVSSTLFKPGISEFNDDISVYGANWKGPNGSDKKDYKPQRQDWISASVGKALTQTAVADIVNNEEYKGVIEKVKDYTGVDLYDLMQQIEDQKKKKSKTGEKGNVNVNTLLNKQNPNAKITTDLNDTTVPVNHNDGHAEVLDDKLLGPDTAGGKKGVIIGDRHGRTKAKYNCSTNYNQFFADVFREASAKETPKKQRFTIN